MEKIGCREHGGAIEFQVAVEYFKEEKCKGCDHFESCQTLKEGAE